MISVEGGGISGTGISIGVVTGLSSRVTSMMARDAAEASGRAWPERTWNSGRIRLSPAASAHARQVCNRPLRK